jgi:L-asparaginase/Glu-tRNA(Gln) amidotransferase subunit D
MRRKRCLAFRPEFDQNVVSVTLHPGLPSRFLSSVLDADPHGIVVRAYGLGMLPEGLFPWLRTAQERDIPVVVTSQMVRGQIDLHRYRKQLTLERLGVISGRNMTYECAVTKLMWALGQSTSLARLRSMMERSLIGELHDE